MKRRIWAGLVVLLVLNVGFLMLRHRHRTSSLNETYAKENHQISEAIAGRASITRPNLINLIGNLATGRSWAKVLPLTKEQKDAITKLDKVTRESRYLSRMADADANDGPPADHRQHYAQNEKRRLNAIHHAQRLVTLGLLTEQQAAFVTQRYLEHKGVNDLYDNDIGVVELIDFTTSQKENLDKVSAEFQQQYYSKIADQMSADPQVQKEYSKWSDAWSRDYKAATWAILTPSQRDKWSQLTAKRSLPAEPPNLARSALSDAEAARIDQEGLSPTFRALDERANALGLSGEQKTLVKDLTEVTRQGLLWISLRKAEGISRVRSEFVKHAEQVLLGILTQRQAEQLQAVVKEK